MLKKVGLVLLLLVIVLGLGLYLGTNNLYGSIVDATLKLSWTNTGDDGYVGQSAVWSLHYAETPDSLVDFWSQTTEVASETTTTPSGQLDSVIFTLPLETGKDYFFGTKIGDEIQPYNSENHWQIDSSVTPWDTIPLTIEGRNWSVLSNIKIINIPDNIPPSPVTDLEYEIIGVN
jgi:hypothetical protein